MPSFETFRECTTAEFEHYVDQRFRPEQIVAGQDYTLMLALFGGVANVDGYAAEVRCVDGPRAYKRPEIWILRMALLDDDMFSFGDAENIYLRKNGLLELTQEFRAEDPDIRDGYIKAHDDSMGNELDSLLINYDLSLKV